MRWLNPPSCYDAAMEREAMKDGLVVKPVFPENVPVMGNPPAHLNESVPAWQRQPPPVKNNGPEIADLVAKDVMARKEMGRLKYRTTLRPNNGRDALTDAYEEAVDLCKYLRQAIYERDKK
jgi:hypothetical protein